MDRSLNDTIAAAIDALFASINVRLAGQITGKSHQNMVALFICFFYTLGGLFNAYSK